LSLIKKLVYYIDEKLLVAVCEEQSPVPFPFALTEVLANVLDNEVNTIPV